MANPHSWQDVKEAVCAIEATPFVDEAAQSPEPTQVRCLLRTPHQVPGTYVLHLGAAIPNSPAKPTNWHSRLPLWGPPKESHYFLWKYW